MRDSVVCHNPRRVLIVRLSAIGDTILTTPLLAAINRQLPQTEVDWVVEPKSRPVVEMCRGISRVFTFPRFPGLGILSAEKRRAFLAQLALVKPELREREYDVALAVQDRLKSGLALAASGARRRVGWRLGDAEELNWVFTNRWAPLPREGHVVDRWLSMLSVIGVRPEGARFPIEPPADAREEIRRYLQSVRSSGPVVIMNIGSSKADRRWPGERHARVAAMARSEFDATPLFTWGSPAERELAEEAVRLSGGAAVLSCPTTLYTLAALVEQADAFVGGDTGPMHLAAALDTPVVGIFGPSASERTGPYGEIHRVVDRHGGSTLTDAESLDSIEPEDVYTELAALLQKGPARKAAAPETVV